MTEKNKMLIKKTFAIYLSALSVAVGICFIVACVSIYRIGENPFSRESISDAFSRIAVPTWLLIGSLAVSVVLSIAVPDEKTRLKGSPMQDELLVKLRARLARPLPESEGAKALGEQKQRKYITCSAIALCAVMAVYPIVYLFIPSNFTLDDMNGDIARAIVAFIPSILVSLGACVAALYLRASSIARETEIIRSVVKRDPSMLTKGACTVVDNEKRKERLLLIARCSVLLVSVVFIIVGITNGGMKDVLSKAIKICTECIGLG